MQFNRTRAAGLVLFVGGVQFAIAELIAQSLYPNYSTSINFISDLGVWRQPSAVIFNPAVIFFGITGLISAYLMWRRSLGRLLPVFIALSGLGGIGVGIFPEDTFLLNGIPIIHSIAAFLTFIFSAGSAIASYRAIKTPLRYVSVVLGVFSLVAFILLLTAIPFLGVGPGTVERLIAYPTLMWTVAFSGYLMAGKDQH